MRRAAPVALDESCGVRENPARLSGDRVLSGPDDDGGRRHARLGDRIEDVGEKRSTGHRVQHFRPRRMHARALAGRQHDRKASPRPRQRLHATSAAVLAERPGRRKPRIRPTANAAYRGQSAQCGVPNAQNLLVFSTDSIFTGLEPGGAQHGRSRGSLKAEPHSPEAARGPTVPRRLPRRSPCAQLRHVTVWGATAAAALLIAVITSRSEVGAERFAAVSFTARRRSLRRTFDARGRDAALADAVRGLNANDEQIGSRLAAVEHDMDDVTGSITKQIEADRDRRHTEDGPSVAATAALTASIVRRRRSTPPRPPASPAGAIKTIPADADTAGTFAYRYRRRYRQRPDAPGDARALGRDTHGAPAAFRGFGADRQRQGSAARQPDRATARGRAARPARRGGATVRALLCWACSASRRYSTAHRLVRRCG